MSFDRFGKELRLISVSLVVFASSRGVRKRSHAGLTLLNVIDSSTEGFLEILSNVLGLNESGIFARRAMVDQAREGLCYQRKYLTLLMCLT